MKKILTLAITFVIIFTVSAPNYNSVQAINNFSYSGPYKANMFQRDVLTNPQTIIDGIKKFHSAVDPNSLDFNLSKAKTIINNDPDLLKLAEANNTVYSHYWIKHINNISDTLAYEAIKEIKKMNANISSAEYHTLNRQIYEFVRIYVDNPYDSKNAYFNLFFSFHNGSAIELVPIGLKVSREIHYELPVFDWLPPKKSYYYKVKVKAVRSLYTP
ncbi:hypothetical protein [Longirhabdus pacifica]|uniref:hypothetical protein n=1 Tax=Longirhabdus pacifica TaxID=2305227 RepID=UPI001009394E|nr:hypothetical protein [Longirhabdus pacifica]